MMFYIVFYIGILFGLRDTETGIFISCICIVISLYGYMEVGNLLQFDNIIYGGLIKAFFIITIIITAVIFIITCIYNKNDKYKINSTNYMTILFLYILPIYFICYNTYSYKKTIGDKTMNEILQVATFAGQIILESGGETYRVEDTILRICKTFGAEQAESFVTPTGIMTSILHKGEIYSLTKRVVSRTVDLNKIDKVNDLSRNILSRNLTVDQFKEELIKINEGERYSSMVTLFFSAFGAGSCAILFGGTMKDMFSAFIIGLLIRLITLKGNELRINFFFINVISGALTAISAVILQKLGLASGIHQTIIGSIMLLVPGLAITNAIRDTIAGDLVSGLTRAAEAFFIAISIAVGTGAGLSICMRVLGGI